MASYRITRNAPGPIQVVLFDPSTGRNQTFDGYDLNEDFARSIRKLHSAMPQTRMENNDFAIPQQSRLLIALEHPGTLVSNSSNLTVQAL
jgi:hypothetical protein